MNTKLCELCNNGASLYCEADNAFLCKSCDAKVHEANFLVARHIRTAICPKSQAFDFDLNENPQSCSSHHDHDHDQQQEEEFSSANSSSNSILSTTTQNSAENKRKSNRISNKKAVEGILVNWCRTLGINGDVKAVLLSSACDALQLCSSNVTALPFRVCLTASFWSALRCCSSGTSQRSLLTWQNLKRLEHVSKVPSKLIVAVEMKLSDAAVKARKEKSTLALAEGWAESP